MEKNEEKLLEKNVKIVTLVFNLFAYFIESIRLYKIQTPQENDKKKNWTVVKFQKKYFLKNKP